MKYLSDVLIVAGAICVIACAAFASTALACAVAGLFMLSFGALIALSRGSVKKDDKHVA